MASDKQLREQISVPVDPAIRAAVERVARREDRTVAQQVRHWIASALAATETNQAA